MEEFSFANSKKTSTPLNSIRKRSLLNNAQGIPLNLCHETVTDNVNESPVKHAEKLILSPPFVTQSKLSQHNDDVPKKTLFGPIGFTTGLGKRVEVTSEGLAKAKSLFNDGSHITEEVDPPSSPNVSKEKETLILVCSQNNTMYQAEKKPVNLMSKFKSNRFIHPLMIYPTHPLPEYLKDSMSGFDVTSKLLGNYNERATRVVLDRSSSDFEKCIISSVSAQEKETLGFLFKRIVVLNDYSLCCFVSDPKYVVGIDSSKACILPDSSFVLCNDQGVISLDTIASTISFIPPFSKQFSQNFTLAQLQWFFKKVAWATLTGTLNFLSPTLLVVFGLHYLKYRLSRKVALEKNSLVARLTSGDLSCAYHALVLKVSSLNVTPDKNIIELTDGFHAVQARMDPALNEIVSSGRLTLMEKLAFYCVDVESEPDVFGDPQDVYGKFVLRIGYNSARKAKPATKMGFLPISLRVYLNTVVMGSKVGCIVANVLKIFPCYYVEKCDSGLWRSFSIDEFEAIIEKRRELNNKLYEDTFERLMSKSKFITSIDFDSVLTNKTSEKLTNKLTKLQVKALKTVDELDQQGRFSKAVKILVQCCGSKNDITFVTLWNPDDDLLASIREKLCYSFFHLSPTKSKFSVCPTVGFQLSSTKYTRIKLVGCELSHDRYHIKFCKFKHFKDEDWLKSNHPIVNIIGKVEAFEDNRITISDNDDCVLQVRDVMRAGELIGKAKLHSVVILENLLNVHNVILPLPTLYYTEISKVHRNLTKGNLFEDEYLQKQLRLYI